MEKQDNEIIITKLEFPDNVRTRPGMYIGETTNADVLLREIVDNSIDEVYSSKSSADKIWISSNSKYHVVVDNGRGLPIRKSLYDDNVTMAYESISSLHSGSKFNKTESAVGTNGVGSSCVSALSEVYHIWSKITEDKLTRTTEKVKLLCKDTDITDKYYHVKTERGILVEEDVQLRSDIEEITGVPVDPSAMTVVAFNPDLTIFDSRSAQLPDTIRFVKYIVNSRGKSVNIYYNGSEVKESFVPFKYDFICNVNSRYDEARNPSVQFLCSLEIDPSEFKSFNQIGSINGLVVNSGYHIKLSEWAFDLALSKRYSKDFRGYSRWGIHMSTIVMAPEPAFSSQTKERCSGIPGIDQSCLDSLVQRYIQVIDENKEVFDAHVTRVLNYISTLKNLGKLDYIKSKISVVADDTRFGSWTPINLNDCTGTNRRECELFIVEGKSAAGTLLPVRDIRKHAVMKLR